MSRLLRLLMGRNGHKTVEGQPEAWDILTGGSGITVKRQSWFHLIFYAVFGLSSIALMAYYLSNTIIHFTTPQQFPINSFQRFPLTLLIFPAELFSFFFAVYFVYLLLSDAKRPLPPKPLPRAKSGKVAILVPVYNEPTEIVERTLLACKKVRWWPGTTIYLLDDSTEASHILAMKGIAEKHDCRVVRRTGREGFKAGNINNAIANIVNEPYFAVFDSDQAPFPEFLEEAMDYFSDRSVGFVQTPQYYINDSTPLERAARMGTNIFFQAQCLSKAKDGAVPFCGTNAVIRTDVFSFVNGFSYYTSTEDVDLGLRINDAGYYGAYVPKILAHGYAPPDFSAYSSQQYRWANGNLAILRENWQRILFGNLSLKQQAHTFFTLGWWLVGLATLIYITVPILSLVLRTGTHHTWISSGILAALYVNVASGILMVHAALTGRTNDKARFTDALLQYSLIINSMFIYARAAIGAALKRYAGFVRTNKEGSKSGLNSISMNLALSAVLFSTSIYALYMAAVAKSAEQLRTYLPVSIWLLFYSIVFASSMLFVGTATKLATASNPAKSRNIRGRLHNA